MPDEHKNQDSAPTPKELRRLMKAVIPDDTSFDAFCLDNFREVHGRFSAGMDRMQKENLLLQMYKDTANILAMLREDYADKVAEYERRNSGADLVTQDLANTSAPHLPASARCIGREQELEWLVGEILASPPRALMILGPPGIGKTTLTIAALHASAVKQRFQSRRYFVRLESATTREQTVTAFIRDLGLRPAGDPWKAVLSMLRTAPALLVLDNLETPWEGAEHDAIEKMLAELGDVPTLLLLGSLKGHTCPDQPHHRSPYKIKPLTLQDARKLFCQVASDVEPQSTALDTLLQDQGGNPLAIRLVASMTQGAGNVENAVKLWQQGGFTKEVKTFELAMASPRLTLAARQLLQVAAWLPAGLHPIDRDALMPGEGLKAEVSLTQAALGFHEGGRLHVYPAIRNYLLHRHPPSQQLQDRIRTHYYGLAQNLGPTIGFRGGEDAMSRLLAEVDNLDMLIQHGLEPRSSQEAIKTAIKLRNFMRLSARGPLPSLYSCFSFASQSNQSKATADCARVIGDVTLDRSQHEEARERYQQAIILYQQIGDIQGQANCIYGLGLIAHERSQHEEARERYQQALAFYRQVGDIQGQANCIYGLGCIAYERSQHEEARERYQQARALYQQVGYIRGETICIWDMGDLAYNCSQYEEAREYYQQALTLYRQVGDMPNQAQCIQALGDVAYECSQYDEARERYQQALDLYKQVGDTLDQAHCIYQLGDLAYEGSQHNEARELYQQALALYKQVGTPLDQAHCIYRLGDLTLERSHYNKDKACSLFNEALSLYLSMPDPDSESIGWTHRSLASIVPKSKRQEHIAAAREAWKGIGALDLIKDLDKEFRKPSKATRKTSRALSAKTRARPGARRK